MALLKLDPALEPLRAVMGSQIVTKGMCMMDDVLGYDGRRGTRSFIGNDLFTIKGACIVTPPAGVVHDVPIVKIELRHDKTPSDIKLMRCTIKELLQHFEPNQRNCPADLAEQLQAAAVKCMENISNPPAPGGLSIQPVTPTITKQPELPEGWGAWA
ncbi:hypothetical protein ATN89_17165 [Comamonas thiooxydans]|uniref:hypothetical protein n=1 Tax=Comamonas thiooxydans TaxID=363952 RepID=UPI0007C593D0|nr:hypothetical protein [Comamonas thiooxydans]OAD82948.1 hypothetical protein ATN89_17165 [Comamonas thiooxydans]